MDAQLASQLVEANNARAEFCRFLSSVYLYELTAEQIEQFAALQFVDDGSKIAEGYATIVEYLRHRNSGTRQELAVDYAHTFLGAGVYDALQAPPYESVFTSEARILMQDARDRALVYYRSEELRLPEDNCTPEDHLGFELQFMAHLIDRSSAALESGDEDRFNDLVAKQSSFFTYHQENWLPDFCDAIDDHAMTDFYRGIAQVTRGYLETERNFLDALKEELGIEGADYEMLPAWANEEPVPQQASMFDAVKAEAEALGAVAPDHD